MRELADVPLRRIDEFTESNAPIKRAEAPHLCHRDTDVRHHHGALLAGEPSRAGAALNSVRSGAELLLNELRQRVQRFVDSRKDRLQHRRRQLRAFLSHRLLEAVAALVAASILRSHSRSSSSNIKKTRSL